MDDPIEGLKGVCNSLRTNGRSKLYPQGLVVIHICKCKIVFVCRMIVNSLIYKYTYKNIIFYISGKRKFYIG